MGSILINSLGTRSSPFWKGEAGRGYAKEAINTSPENHTMPLAK